MEWPALDRATGAVLSADAYVRINSSKGVDLKSGRLIPNDEKTPQTGKVIRDIAPAALTPELERELQALGYIGGEGQ